jgi:hypothetical protein
MSVKEQAIKIEQLKQERDEAHDAIFSEILSVGREIDSISNEMFKLGDKRQKLYKKLRALKEKRVRNESHFDLLIRARQSLIQEAKP